MTPPAKHLHWLLFAGLLAGCSDADPTPPTPAEASVDAAVDVLIDASIDALSIIDAPSIIDTVAPIDVPLDVPPDLPIDAPIDAPAEASLDAPRDVVADVPTIDRGADTGADVGTPIDAPRTDVTLDAPADVTLDAPTDAPADAAPDVPPLDAAPGSWRSALFPDDWVPLHAGGRADAQGRFLHDFSFAGYHRGDERPPYGRGSVVRTVDARLGDGIADATAAIQADLDAACASTVAGLRVVLLPAGTYRLRFPTPSPATDPALRIRCSNLVLRGAGADATRLFLDDPTNARSRAMLRVAPTSVNVWAGTPSTALTRDLPLPSRTVSVASTAGFAVGDAVSVRTDVTEGFRAEHRMNVTEGAVVFWPASTAQGLLYPRRITAIDAAARTITLDAPTRYGLQARDNARLFRTAGYLTEVGIEDLAFGMREHPTTASGTPGPLGDRADDAYATVGTAAYAVHGAVGIRLDGLRDAWLYRVRTFSPAGNTSGAHVLSSAVFLTAGTTRVTVESCRLESPQYRGGGGNGYLFWVESDDHLLVSNEAVGGRHNFIMAHVACSGNVFLRARSTNSRYSDDSHRLLSQANLYDGTVLDGAWLQAVNRGSTSSGAGFTATHTVFWNTRVVAPHASTRRAGDGFAAGFAIETSQFGWGYAIGTSGPGSAVVTARVLTNTYWSTLDRGAPDDFVEGVGMGATLYPPSLYEEQLRRRRLRRE